MCGGVSSSRRIKNLLIRKKAMANLDAFLLQGTCIKFSVNAPGQIPVKILSHVEGSLGFFERKWSELRAVALRDSDCHWEQPRKDAGICLWLLRAP